MKNYVKIFCMMIGMIVCISNTNAQSPEGWEDEVVDMVVYGSGEASIKPAEDTILITGPICDEFNNGRYKGYLPIVLEYPEIQEFIDDVPRETIGYSRYLRVNDVCQITALTAGPRTHDYSGIKVFDAYTRPAQMRPFTDTIYVEEGKQYTLKPWHWVPYEEPYVNPTVWTKDGEEISDQWGMKLLKINGPTQGDTAIYTVRVCDDRIFQKVITNTFVIIGTPKSDFGVEDNEILNFSVYPNPSNDGVVTIKGNGTAKIFNILGQEIKSIEVNEETKIFLNSGMYIIQMGNLTKKVVVR